MVRGRLLKDRTLTHPSLDMAYQRAIASRDRILCAS